MSAWRREAIERVPSKKLTIEQSPSPMSLWIELHLAAARAFESRPKDDVSLRGIFGYARYCLTGRDDDVRTAVVVAFFEDIVRSELAREDLHRWISQTEFDSLCGAFQYHLAPDVFASFDESFRRNRLAYGKRPVPRSGRG